MNEKLKKNLMLFFKIFVSIGIIVYIFRKQVDFNQVYSYVKMADIFLLAIAKLIFLSLLVLTPFYLIKY